MVALNAFSNMNDSRINFAANFGRIRRYSIYTGYFDDAMLSDDSSFHDEDRFFTDSD